MSPAFKKNKFNKTKLSSKTKEAQSNYNVKERLNTSFMYLEFSKTFISPDRKETSGNMHEQPSPRRTWPAQHTHSHAHMYTYAKRGITASFKQ